MKITLHSRALWSQLITTYRTELVFVSTEENTHQAENISLGKFSFQLSHIMIQRAQGQAFLKDTPFNQYLLSFKQWR